MSYYDYDTRAESIYMPKRTPSEIVLLSLSLLATVTISPFIFFRWMNGDTTLAIIDGIISLTAITFFIFIYITRKIEISQKIFAIFLTVATVTTVFIKGESQALWIFPTVIAVYYLMSLKTASIVSPLLVISTLIILYPRVDSILFFSILATTSLTITLSFVIFRSYHETQNELTLLASIDSLTSSGNRRALDLKLSEVIAIQQRHAYTMSLILIDLDEFKEINDSYGHAIGDQILVTVCELIKKHTRVLDTLYRFGGDEFIIMPLNMNINAAKILAEKIRCLIEQHTFVNNIKLTLSIGVAEYNTNDTLDSWISRADAALYKAKENGRNNVC